MEDHGVIVIEEEDEEVEVEYEEETEDESDDEDGSEEEELIPAVLTSPRASNPGLRADNLQEAVVCNEDLVDNPSNMKSCKGKLNSQENVEDDGDGAEEFDRGEIDGLFCPICIEAWTNGGEHQICCLPCGHIYGLSCIKKWLRQRRNSGKCPQCNRRCTLKDVRVLYAARLCVADAQLQKQVQSLEAKCASLEQKNSDCCKKEVKAQEREADLLLKVQQLTKKAKDLERLLEDRQRESSGSFTGQGIDSGSRSQAWPGIFTPQILADGSTAHNHHTNEWFYLNNNALSLSTEATSICRGLASCNHIWLRLHGEECLKGEFLVDGGRYFDMDASGQLMIVARRLNGLGGTNLLTKISLAAPEERENIQLPANSKAVRALCVKPCSRLVLLASLGKKLSVVSTESNNTVLTYDLPAPAWSCSWDINSSNHVYTGLQNGMLLAFDMRQTRRPLESRAGLSCNPVHTVISVAPNSSLSSGTRTLLTASQIGICEWNIDASEERPYLIPESENQGVCISLAHSGSDDIVASFRPKIETSTQMAFSQSLSTPAISSMDCGGVEGCHVFYKRSGSQSYQKTGSLLAPVDRIRLPKSCIINQQNHAPMFVSAKEVMSELVLHDISTLTVLQHLKTTKNQIWDVRCTEMWKSCVLGCLSGDKVQLFTRP